MKSIYFVWGLLFLVISTSAVETSSSSQTGNFTITESGLLLKDYKYLSKINLTPDKDGKVTYENKGSKVQWKVYVPPSYDGSKPFGIYTYISPGNSGNLPGKWRNLMNKHNLIWVSADNVGNKISRYWREAASIEGTKQILAKYNINKERLILSGFSGGGRMASMMAVGRPDLYTGAVYFCGCNTWSRKIKSKVFKKAKDHYYAFITGTKDFNLNDTKGVYSSYQRAKFKNIKLQVIDGLGHKTPGEADLDEALMFIDTPAIARAKEFFEKAQKSEKYKRYGEALQFYKIAAGKIPAAEEKAKMYQEELDSLKAEADKAETDKDYSKAFENYNLISSKFGRELGADAAKKVLSYKKDKKILLEIRAMTYFKKIEAAIKKGLAKDKIVKSLKIVIEKSPGTKASENAAKLLKTLSSQHVE